MRRFQFILLLSYGHEMFMKSTPGGIKASDEILARSMAISAPTLALFSIRSQCYKTFLSVI
jgi:hypothetical protein